MADVDAAGIIYFGAAPPWAERLFTGWLADLGQPMSRLIADDRACPVVEARISYRAPLRLDDVVELELDARRIGERSFTVGTRVLLDGELAVDIELVHVCITGLRSTPASVPVPDWLRRGLEGGIDGR
jgi:acyl-CoA thioester hydrolase